MIRQLLGATLVAGMLSLSGCYGSDCAGVALEEVQPGTDVSLIQVQVTH